MAVLLVMFAELSEGLGGSGIMLLVKANSYYALHDTAEGLRSCLFVVCLVGFALLKSVPQHFLLSVTVSSSLCTSVHG